MLLLSKHCLYISEGMLSRHICATVLQLIVDLFKPFHRTKEDIISIQLKYVVKSTLDFVEVLPNISYTLSVSVVTQSITAGCVDNGGRVLRSEC
jgi:hypothetical protein